MISLRRAGFILALMPMVFLAACQKEEGPDPGRKPDPSYQPDIEAVDFPGSTLLDNPFLGPPAGKTYIYQGQTEEGVEKVEVKRLADVRNIMGIGCAGVEDKVWLNGILLERTVEWCAQDENGAVWLFAEDVDNFNTGGALINRNGSWEAGVDGALPGILMQPAPRARQAYRQQYYFNIAEDEAEVVETGLTIAIPLGTFSDCIKIKEWTALEPDVLEYKYYAPGFGLIKAVNATDNEELILAEVRE